MTNQISTKNRAGFSLIEVMVATLILLIIVLMIGSIFRQGTAAWDTGYARAEGGMIVRGVVGSIQRELSTAVDGRLFPDWSSPDPVDVVGNRVSFICLKESISTGEREPWFVTYAWSGSEMTRSASPLKNDGSGWVTGGGPQKIYSEAGQEDEKTIYEADFEFGTVRRDSARDLEKNLVLNDVDFKEGIFWKIPYVTITVKLTRRSSFSGLEMRSWGPDGEAGTDDDIIVQ